MKMRNNFIDVCGVNSVNRPVSGPVIGVVCFVVGIWFFFSFVVVKFNLRTTDCKDYDSKIKIRLLWTCCSLSKCSGWTKDSERRALVEGLI